MTSKHTPGPWKLAADNQGGGTVYGKNPAQRVAVVTSAMKGPVATQADARLIAAAPAMLAALEAAFSLVKESGFNSGLDESTFDKTLFQIGDAIAQAKGE